MKAVSGGGNPVPDAHLSIGEVLDLLKDEYPDITISKIRFLESQGLIDPERTPSGYRKFYGHDIERLRWVLLQQRDHFLPLKIIKDRLQTTEVGSMLADSGTSPETTPSNGAPASVVPALPIGPRPDFDPEPGVAISHPDPEVPTPKPAPEQTGLLGPLLGSLTSATFSLDELSNATGLTREQIRELERYGIVTGRAVGGHVIYDEEALVAGRLARDLGDHGVEARHLRMYKTAAEREAGFYEQMVLPLIKQRNPASRRQAIEKVGDLARLGESLRASLLRQGLRSIIEGSDPGR